MTLVPAVCSFFLRAVSFQELGFSCPKRRVLPYLITYIYLYFGGNQAFTPCPVSRICETCLNHVLRSTASCFANGSHWVVHLWPNFPNHSIGSRSSLTKFHQLFRGPLWRLFHELCGSARRIRRGKYYVGLRKIWPNHFSRSSLITMTTHLLILQVHRLSMLDM